MNAPQHVGRLAKRMTGGGQDFTAWAKTPPAYGAAGSVWERMIIELAEGGDARFVAILREHIDAGVIRAERAHAVLQTGGVDAAA